MGRLCHYCLLILLAVPAKSALAPPSPLFSSPEQASARDAAYAARRRWQEDDTNAPPLPRTIVPPRAGASATSSFCAGNVAGGWVQVWADEFDGSALDNSSWTVDLGANDSRVRDSKGTSDNVYLDGRGALVLRTQRHTTGDYAFTSGAVQSQNKRFFGGADSAAAATRVCVSAKLPGGGGGDKGAGIWPAHWLMPNTKACWPTNGEIDIMEMINGDGVLHGTYHWAAAEQCGHNSQNGGRIELPADFSSAWHEYAVE